MQSHNQNVKSLTSYRPAFEPLEDRCLMATSLLDLGDVLKLPPSLSLSMTASLSQGVLRIEGTYSADTIRVRQVNGQVSIDGIAASFAAGQVQKIEVLGHGGNDSIFLNSEVTPGQQPITVPCLVRGGSGNVTVVGSTAADIIFGDAGDDQLWAHTGNDFVDGGDGADFLHGSSGNDSLYGDLGNDTLLGGEGLDDLVGGRGNDSLLGGTQDDWLDGSSGSDVLKGESGYDRLYDDFFGNSFSDSGSNKVVFSHFGWCDMKLEDAVVRSLARYLGRDGCLSRADMLELFQQVEDDSVTSSELGDLKDIVAGGSYAPYLPAYVHNLAKKVVSGDAANASYQGTPLGNLYAGAAGEHLDKLVNKWFFGLDRPQAGGTYQYAAGNLFQAGIQYTDIVQGGVGDCYLMAALAKIALRAPAVIQNLFIDNGDGTFTIRFFRNGTAEYVTVDRYLPVNDSGYVLYAGIGGKHDNPNTELWVALVEKAYVQVNESGWIGQDGTNSYAGIEFGKPAEAMKHITGKSASGYLSLNKDDLLAALNAGKLVCLSSKKEQNDIPDRLNVVARHVYAVIGYHAASGRFTLYNPWGSSLSLTWTQIVSGFRAWHRGNVV